MDLRTVDKIIPTHTARRQRGALHPWLYGERTPADNPSLRAGFLNISLDTNRSDLLRTAFEGSR